MITRPITRPLTRAIASAITGGSYESSSQAFPAKSFYFNDFTGIANNTKLRDLPGWAAYNTLNATTAERDQWQIQSEGLTRINASQDYDSNPGKFVVGYNTGSTDHVIKFTLVTLPISGADLTVVVAGTDNKNAVYIGSANSGGVMQTLYASKNTAGTAVSLSSGVPVPAGLGRPIQAGDKFEIHVLGSKLHIRINEIQITPDAGFDIDRTTSFTKGNLVGFGTRGNYGVVVDDVYIAPMAAALSINAPAVFIPGSMILGGRSAPVSGTYSGTVSALDYRVVNSVTGAVVKPWARVTAPTVAGGVWSASVFVPMCDTTINPKIKIQVRAANDTDATVLSTATCVGLTVGAYGQSNSAYRGQGAATSHAVAHSYTWSSDASSVWQSGGATTTLRSQLWATKLAAITGIPCGVLVLGKGSASIQNLTTIDWGVEALNKTIAASANGYVASWLWTQGESEAAGTDGVNISEYRGHFDNLIGLLGGISATPTPKIGICVIGKNTGAHTSGATLGAAYWSGQRANLFNLTDKPNVYISTNLSDAAMIDSLHYTADAYVESGRRAALSMAKAMGYSTHDGRGPLLSTATRSGAVITLPINLNGAVSVAGTGLTNYDVSVNDFASNLATTSVAVVGNNLVITLVADPAAPVKVRSFYGMSYGTPTLAIGTYADGTTIPLEPIFNFVESGA
jgi:hypothetical protein